MCKVAAVTEECILEWILP